MVDENLKSLTIRLNKRIVNEIHFLLTVIRVSSTKFSISLISLTIRGISSISQTSRIRYFILRTWNEILVDNTAYRQWKTNFLTQSNKLLLKKSLYFKNRGILYYSASFWISNGCIILSICSSISLFLNLTLYSSSNSL